MGRNFSVGYESSEEDFQAEIIHNESSEMDFFTLKNQDVPIRPNSNEITLEGNVNFY